MNSKQRKNLAILDWIAISIITVQIVFTILIINFSSNKGMNQLFIYLAIICFIVGIKTVINLKKNYTNV